jgi:hypothetical protein
MLQDPQQAHARTALGRFPPGVSGNPKGKESLAQRRARHAAMMDDIERDIGGELSPADRILVSKAVDLLMAKPRLHNDRVRAINAADRILQRIRERRAPKRAPADPWLVSLVDHEDRARAGPATPLAGGSNDRAGERPCASGEPFAGEEPLGRRIERARIGDVVRIGNVEVEIIAADDESAE